MELPFKHLGKNVLIDASVLLVNPENMILYDNVRIDCFSFLSASEGTVAIGPNVHVSANNTIISGSEIAIKKHCTFSFNNTLIGKTDTFDGTALIGPMAPLKDRKVQSGPIIMNEFSTIASYCLLMPNTMLPAGTVIGSFSFCNGRKKLDAWTIYAGNPLQEIKKRRRDIESFR